MLLGFGFSIKRFLRVGLILILESRPLCIVPLLLLVLVVAVDKLPIYVLFGRSIIVLVVGVDKLPIDALLELFISGGCRS
jgi:hypothetical protein